MGKVGLGAAVLLAAMGTSAANVALPAIAADLGAALPRVQWVVVGYLLAVTVAVVEAGRLGDRHGHRRMLLAGVGLFAVAAGGAVVAPGIGWLIAARVVQGAGAALMMVLPLALLRGTVAQERLGQAIGLMGTMSAVGTALGPSLGGLVLAGAGWRAVFGLLAAGAALVFVGLLRLPRVARKPVVAASPQAALLFALAVTAYALAMTAGVVWAVPLALAAVGFGWLFRRADQRSAAPLISAELRDNALRAGLAMNAVVGAVMMATLVVGPFYLMQGLGLSSLHAGLALSVGPVLSALSGVPAGRLSDRIGGEAAVRLGLGVMLAGTLALAGLPALTGLPGYLAAMAVLTPGYQLFLAANTAETMARAPAERRGATSGLLSLSRNLGLMTGAALMAGLFGWASGGAAEGATVGLACTFGLAAGMLAGALSLGGTARAVPGPVA